MKQTFWSMIAMAFVAAFACSWHAVRETAGEVYRVYQAAKCWVVKTTRAALTLAARSESLRRPMVLLVQAKAFVLSLAKRERPVVTSGWRYCPST